MSDVEGALRRARIRIRYHGWRRSGSDKKVPGWTLREAIIGHKPGLIPEHELQAILAVSEAIGVPSEELDTWNDAPYRTVKDVLKAISRARKSISTPPLGMPDRCAQRRMAAVDDVMGPIEPEEFDETKAEVAEGESPLSSVLATTQAPVPEGGYHYAPSEEQVDLEQVIKDKLRGN